MGVLIPSGWLSAQQPTISLTGPSEVERGYYYEYTATFNHQNNERVQSYQFILPFIGDDVAGPSGLVGNVEYNGSELNFPHNIMTSSNSVSIRIRWGDFFEQTEETLEVICSYEDSIGNPTTENKLEVDVRTVCPPTILVASSIQKCCSEVVSYCVDFECDADQYQWEVTNATIVDGQGTSCIDIQPNLLGVVDLSCTVSRASGHPDYTRVHSMNVSRFNPLTPAIIKTEDFICTDSTLTLSVEKICGLEYISWILPPQLEIIWSNEDSTQIEVGVVNAVSPVIGKGVTFGAEAILNNACNLNAGEVVDSLLIYTAEVPPLPVGEISLRPFPEGEEDSCQIVAWEVIFEGNPPYENGTTTVFPTNIPNLPHKANEDSISIEVCNENACSNLESCTTFVIAAPPYCEGEIFGRADEGGFEEMSSPKEQIAREVISRKDDGGVLAGAIWIYPNPFRENLKIILNKPGSWQLELFNVHGVMMERQSAELKMMQWDIGNYVRNIPSGTYYLRVTGGRESIVQKLIKL